jgi:hypothetical protein
MKAFENTGIDPKSNRPTGLRFREDQGRFWWELRSCDYYEAFERPKLRYVDIMWSATFSLDAQGRYTNNTGYFIPAGSEWLTAVMNAPVGWHHAWRRAQHGKDKALRYFTSFVEAYPVPPAPDDFEAVGFVGRIGQLRETTGNDVRTILDWLRHEFGLEKPGQALAQPHLLDADAFVAALSKALPRSRKFSAADIARLKQEHATTLGPARAAAGEALALERRLSDLVNAAYGLTPEEVKLMWDTAPPRMPFLP